MTDFDRIVDTLAEHGITNKSLANDLLELLIDVAGDNMLAVEKARYSIYDALLNQKVVKPEYMSSLYNLRAEAEKKLK